MRMCTDGGLVGPFSVSKCLRPFLFVIAWAEIQWNGKLPKLEFARIKCEKILLQNLLQAQWFPDGVNSFCLEL